MISIGSKVRSLRDRRLGIVVGYGILQWPTDPDINGDESPVAVYLVRVAIGSSSLGPACIVMRADQVEPIDVPAVVCVNVTKELQP